MTWTSYSTDKYAVQLSSGRPETPLPDVDDRPKRQPVSEIFLYEGDKNRGWVSFYPDGSRLQLPVHSGGRVFLEFHFSRFQAMMEILRTEKLINFLYETGEREFVRASITTLHEPVGEEEQSS